MIKSKYLFSFLLFFLISLFGNNFSLHAQNKNELEKKKQQLLQDIEITQKILRETSQNKAITLNQLVTLNKQIATREKLINNIGSQISIIDRQINELGLEIDKLKLDLAKLKKEYAAMIVFAYRNQSSYNKLMFVFAAQSFNQAYKRLKYIQQFNEYRRKQADFMVKTQMQLNEKIQELIRVKNSKNVLLLDEQNEKVKLGNEKNKQQSVAQTLQEKEKQLRKELKEKQKETQKLDRAIADIIKREIEEARKRAEAEAKKAGNKPAGKSSTGLSLTPEGLKLSNDFSNNKGKFPWPVVRGIITEGFGDHEHPVLKGVMTRNNGVDIKTEKGSDARAIFAGTVAAVYVGGAKKGVIIIHGDYFTVYQNLREVYVKSGDKIAVKQPLGSILFDERENDTELQFQIWKAREGQEPLKLDPADWLAN